MIVAGPYRDRGTHVASSNVEGEKGEERVARARAIRYARIALGDGCELDPAEAVTLANTCRGTLVPSSAEPDILIVGRAS